MWSSSVLLLASAPGVAGSFARATPVAGPQAPTRGLRVHLRPSLQTVALSAVLPHHQSGSDAPDGFEPPVSMGFQAAAAAAPAIDGLPSPAVAPLELPFVPQALPELPELELSSPVTGFDLPATEPVAVEPDATLVVQLAPPEKEVAMPTLRELAAFCLPSLGIWLSSPLLSLIDTSVVGVQCATTQLAALGPSTKLCDYVAFFCTVLSAATTNLAAAAFADKEPAEAKHIIASSLTVSLAVGGGLALLLRLLAQPAMAAMLGASGAPSVVAAASTYTSVRAIGFPAALLTMILQAGFLATKDAKTPLLAVPLTAFANLLGDLVLVGPLGMGAAGAAWATVGSLYVNAISLALLWRRKARHIAGHGALFAAPSVGDVRRLAAFAAPLFVALAARVYMGLSLTLTAVALGTASLAANQVIECLYWLFCPFGEAISLCMQAFLPSLLTKGKLYARKLQTTGFHAALALGAFAASAAMLLPVACPGLFTTAAPVAAQMAAAAPMLGAGLFFFVIACASEGMLIARKQLRVLAASHSLNTLSLVFALRALARRSGTGLHHIWAVLALCNLMRLGEFAIALRRAENAAVAEPGAVVRFLRRPQLALLRLGGNVVGVRRVTESPGVAQPDEPSVDAIDVPDIAGTHPHLL